MLATKAVATYHISLGIRMLDSTGVETVDPESVRSKVYGEFERDRSGVCEVHGPRIHGLVQGPWPKLRTALRAKAQVRDASAVAGHRGIVEMVNHILAMVRVYALS